MTELAHVRLKWEALILMVLNFWMLVLEVFSVGSFLLVGLTQLFRQ